MKSHPQAQLAKQTCEVLTATLLVAGCPIALVWWLRASGTLSSPVLGVALGMVASLLVSLGGRLLWERIEGSEDLLFNELMLWGFIHRLRSQRRLASALEMVGPLSERRRAALDGLGVKERAKLLEELVASMETRDPYLHGHSRRVARHSWMIAKRMGLPREEVARVRMAAALHDVGKTRTPTAILHKPGALTDEEYDVIKRHPGDGALMVSVLHDERLAAMVRHHHERLDGSGYPSGLGGQEIPLGARIIAVADTFDAITSARPYRDASAHRRAIEILRAEAGTRLDGDVVRAFQGHYAGNGPLALWSLLASLPERILSWLGGSVASVATAAKVVAVAALVGGAAAGSAGLTVNASAHRVAFASTSGTAGGTVASQSGGTMSSYQGSRTGASRSTAGGPGAHARQGLPASPVRRTGASGLGSGAIHGGSTGTAVSERHGTEGPREQAGESPRERVSREESSTQSEEPKAKSEEPRAKGKEPKAKGEEPKAKGEEPKAKGEEPAKGHEPTKGGKSEEAPGHKEEVAHSKGGEKPVAVKEEKPAKEEKVKEEKPAKEEPAAKEEKGSKPGTEEKSSSGKGTPGEGVGKTKP